MIEGEREGERREGLDGWMDGWKKRREREGRCGYMYNQQHHRK